MHKVIGILGGMGPEATILMMSRLLAATPAKDDFDHIPLLVDSNTQIPSRIAHLVDKTGIDPTTILVSMAQKLATGGAEILAMPCNTAHSYYAAIARGVDVPFLNMVDLTADKVVGMHPHGPVGILASPAVQITGIFADAFNAFGREVIYPADSDRLLLAIRAIKARNNNFALPILEDAAIELSKAGAPVAVVGCSEFSIIAPQFTHAPLALVDSLDVLVEACISYASGSDT